MNNGARIEAHERDVYRVSGELTLHTVPALWREAEALFADAAAGEVCVDLAQVQRCDSAALALLIEIMHLGRGRGVRIHFEHLPVQLLDIARLSGVLELLPGA